MSWRDCLGTRRRRLGAVGALLALGVSLAFGRYLFLGNFGVVDPGRVYRAAQPREPLDWLGGYQVKSVLNLRGGSRADPWYAAEVDFCRRQGIAFYDLPMVATRRPSRAELLVLLDFLEHCPYPLLIHCKSGSDRTGLVSALYRLSVLSEPPQRAVKAFSAWHGHLPLGGTELLQEPFQEYAAWLKAGRRRHTRERFHHWVELEYRSRAWDDDPAIPLRPGPRPQVSATPPRTRR